MAQKSCELQSAQQSLWEVRTQLDRQKGTSQGLMLHLDQKEREFNAQQAKIKRLKLAHHLQQERLQQQAESSMRKFFSNPMGGVSTKPQQDESEMKIKDLTVQLELECLQRVTLVLTFSKKER